MHGRHALLFLLVVGLVPLSGCIGVDNMTELRRELTGEQLPTIEPVPDPVNVPPEPTIAAPATEALAGEALTFDGSASSDPDGRIVAWEWTVDGRAAGASPVLVHAFETAGTHVVQLTIEDDRGDEATASVEVTVRPDQPPTAQISVAPVGEQGGGGGDGEGAGETVRGVAGTPLSFSAEQSTDPEGRPLSFDWDLGDGTTATDETLLHTFARGGVYTVTLTVTDPAGGNDTATRVLAVDAEGSTDGEVSLQAPTEGLSIPVRAGARTLEVTLAYAADLPLEDLDLTAVGPGGSDEEAPDGEGVLPGDRTVTLTVDAPAAGTWDVEVALDLGLEAAYVVSWVVRY